MIEAENKYTDNVENTMEIENDKPSRRQTNKHQVPEGTISMSTISSIRK